MTPKPANKPTIAVDIDDVIAAHAPAFVKYTNDKWGTNLKIENYHDHWSEVWQVDHAETENRAREYHSSGYIGTYGVIEGASDALQQLKVKYRLIIITTRQISIDRLTKEWINRYYPNTFEEIIFAGFFDDPKKSGVHLTKGELALKAEADYIIDDQLKHCISAADLGIKALVFGDYPWNQADELPKGVTRVKNWREVQEYFGGTAK